MIYLFIYHNGEGNTRPNDDFVIRDVDERTLGEVMQSRDFYNNLVFFMPYKEFHEGVSYAMQKFKFKNVKVPEAK